jgi:hypothetical protein
MARLTPAQQRLCRNLMEVSVSELARRRGIPRQTLADKIEKLKASFASVAPTKNL